jgi:hypothetical protein
MFLTVYQDMPVHVSDKENYSEETFRAQHIVVELLISIQGVLLEDCVPHEDASDKKFHAVNEVELEE